MSPVELFLYVDRDGRYHCRLRREPDVEIRTESAMSTRAAAVRALDELQILDESRGRDVL